MSGELKLQSNDVIWVEPTFIKRLLKLDLILNGVRNFGVTGVSLKLPNRGPGYRRASKKPKLLVSSNYLMIYFRM